MTAAGGLGALQAPQQVQAEPWWGSRGRRPPEALKTLYFRIPQRAKNYFPDIFLSLKRVDVSFYSRTVKRDY